MLSRLMHPSPLYLTAWCGVPGSGRRDRLVRFTHANGAGFLPPANAPTVETLVECAEAKRGQPEFALKIDL